MKYTVNTKQRLYLADNKFVIMLYRKLSIHVYRQSKLIAIDYEDENVFKKTFSARTYNAIKKDVNCLLLAASCELLMNKYNDDVVRIIKNNREYIQKIFRDLM